MFTLADAIAAGARIDVAHVLRDLSAILLGAQRGGHALRRLTADRVLCIGDARGVVLTIDSWHDARPIANAPADVGASVHALGMIAIQIATGVMPYAATTLATLGRTSSLATQARLPARLAWLVDRMLARDPADRPSLAEIHEQTTKLLAAPAAAPPAPKVHPRVRARIEAPASSDDTTRIELAI
jgi:hypothetical protein